MSHPIELPEVQLTPYIVPEDQETDESLDIAIDETQIFLLERGNGRASMQERAAFERKLQADIRKIKSTLACLKLTGASPDQMKQEVAIQIAKLKRSYENFSTSKAKFIQAKSEVVHSLDAFEARANAPKEKTWKEMFPNQQSPEKVKTPWELMAEDDFWEKTSRLMERGEVVGDMTGMRMAVAIPQKAVEAVCGVDPGVQQICEKAAIVLQKGEEAVRDFLFTPEEQQNRQRNIQRDAQVIEERVGIPQEDVLQYHAGRAAVAVGHVIGAGVVVGGAGISKLRHLAKNAPVPSLQNFLIDESGAIPLGRKAYSRIEMIRLFKENHWQEVPGGKGSHTKMKKEGFPKVAVIPSKKDVPTGTAQYLLKLLNESTK